MKSFLRLFTHNYIKPSFNSSYFFQFSPFWIQLLYFLIFSLLGYFGLKVLNPRTPFFRPNDLNLFFTSVSATTVSSMSTVEMEVFSNTQLVLLTFLMLIGGEVFTSMLGLQFMRSKFCKNQKTENIINSDYITDSDSITNSDSTTCSKTSFDDQIELGFDNHPEMSHNLKYNSIKCLSYVVSCYLLVVLVSGSTMICLYIIFIQSAREVLKNKGLQILTFSVFTTVSTFTNCGFIPTNENMIVFKKNSGLLLLLVAQILLGNTLYPMFLRFAIWVLERITRREEFRYILKNVGELGYEPMVSGVRSWLLGVTVLGFIFVQFVLFCSMEWKSEAMDGLSSYQKLVGSLFQVVNSRHAGESVFDLSIISPAILVLFVVMMYLPPYTSFLPIADDEKVSGNDRKKCRRQMKKFMESLLFSQLSYLVIFIILICITERKKLKEDPLNFNVLNITIEVISAYGNVGFSTGYSCKRQLKPEGYCEDAWYGFAGRWSDNGKIILILVMFFGRLKKFNMEGGQAWKLS